MKHMVVILLIYVFLGCSHNNISSLSIEEKTREYDSTTVTLSDFSMKIMGHLKFSVPENFDTQKFFTLLEKIYPDQSRVRTIHNNYQVSVRNLDRGGYSVMLCDPETNQKIMEDLSCHLNHVEIKSWKSPIVSQCVFENEWKSYCQ